MKTPETQSGGSLEPVCSGRGRWTPPTAKGCSWERCTKRAVINHRIFGPLCWRHMREANRFLKQPNTEVSSGAKDQ